MIYKLYWSVIDRSNKQVSISIVQFFCGKLYQVFLKISLQSHLLPIYFAVSQDNPSGQVMHFLSASQGMSHLQESVHLRVETFLRVFVQQGKLAKPILLIS